jgi:hypothetical protein
MMNRPNNQPQVDLLRLGLFVFMALSATLGVWLLGRRFSGQLVVLNAQQVLASGGGLAVILLAWREVRLAFVCRPANFAERWMPSLVAIVFLGTLASNSGPWPSWFAVVVAVALLEYLWLRYRRNFTVQLQPLVASSDRMAGRLAEEGGEPSTSPPSVSRDHDEEGAVDEEGVAGALEDSLPPDDVEQQWVRSRTEEGAQQVWGVIRVKFVAEQRIEIAHVSFCPLLDGCPEIEAYAVDGPDATVRVTSAKMHGARIEIRLARAAPEAATVTVEVVAVAVNNPAPANVEDIATPRA